VLLCACLCILTVDCHLICQAKRVISVEPNLVVVLFTMLQDVTPDNFIAALSGRDDLVKGVGTGKVIKRLVYYFTCHRDLQSDSQIFINHNTSSFYEIIK